MSNTKLNFPLNSNIERHNEDYQIDMISAMARFQQK